MIIGPEVTDSIELKFSALARQMNAEGKTIISLGLGEPDFPTPQPIIDAATQAMIAGRTRYSSPLGIGELRARIAKKLADENGIRARSGHILVAPGAKMALSLALGALLTPGDEVVVLTPCYPSYIPQAKLAEPKCVVRTLDLRADDFEIDFEAMAGLLNARTKAIIVNYPNNPTGKMLSRKNLEELVRLASAHDCWIISDEIYEKLSFTGTQHLSPAAHDELSGRTITINGFSKAYSMTGWRIGYLHVPDEALLGLMSKLQQHHNTNTATFIQHAALAAFDLPEDYLDAYNGQLAANHLALEEMVAKNSRLSLVDSDGGLFAFLDISKTGVTADEFSTGLLEQGSVATIPGVVFGASWNRHIRISLATNCGEFLQGVECLGEFARGL